MSSGPSGGKQPCDHHHDHNDPGEIELSQLGDDTSIVPVSLTRRATTWSSTGQTRVDTWNTEDCTESSKGKEAIKLTDFDDVELTELEDMVPPLPTHRDTALSAAHNSKRRTRFNNDSQTRQETLDQIAPTISSNSDESIGTLTASWQWRQGQSYSKKDPQTKLDEPPIRRDTYLGVLPQWRAIADKYKQKADDISISKYQNGGDTAEFHYSNMEEHKARDTYREASKAWDTCMLELYGRSMDAAVRITAQMLTSIKKEQKKRYGQSTDIDDEVLTKTWKDAMYTHFDETLSDFLMTWNHQKPVKKKELKKADEQMRKLRELHHALNYGTISMRGDRDSVTCTWISRTVEERGLPGPGILFGREPKDKSRIVTETGWIWKDGEVTFLGTN
ncbi:hypothetical protein V865_001776 [Kwoniella europaea PYCC6329]|uniref:Uncharacterized protein n=1 Tax=Kwoniella europaea PYCC6329 TaxID=1423913 RepID=A0AAX4KDT3_9TREE